MLHCLSNTVSRGFLLDYISPDGRTGCLIPQKDICTTHHPIAVSLYEDGVLRIGRIRIDTRKIVSDLKACGITATAFEDDIVGVSISLNVGQGSVFAYFEYAQSRVRQEPPYIVRSGAPLYWLKPFAGLHAGQKAAKILSFGRAYPRVTV